MPGAAPPLTPNRVVALGLTHHPGASVCKCQRHVARFLKFGKGNLSSDTDEDQGNLKIDIILRNIIQVEEP